jgi:hypothetical protein
VSCRELVELVTDYFEGALSENETALFEQHIADCAWCTRYLEQMRITIETVGHIDEESIAPEMRETLLVAFNDWRAGERPLP